MNLPFFHFNVGTQTMVESNSIKNQRLRIVVLNVVQTTVY